MTEQEIFNQVVAGLAGQGFEQSKDMRPNPTTGEPSQMCLYRGPGGKKCAVGHLITDEEYDPAWENLTLRRVMSKCATLTRFEPHRGLLEGLQRAHDAADGPYDMQRRLIAVAKDHGLNLPPGARVTTPAKPAFAVGDVVVCRVGEGYVMRNQWGTVERVTPKGGVVVRATKDHTLSFGPRSHSVRKPSALELKHRMWLCRRPQTTRVRVIGSWTDHSRPYKVEFDVLADAGALREASVELLTVASWLDAEPKEGK